MVETWHIEAASGSHAVAASSVALLLEASSHAEPAGRMLAFLSHIAPVDYLSLVEYVDDRSQALAAPELREGHAVGQDSNVTAECFAHYRQHFWREDRATLIAQHLGRVGSGATVTGLHFRASDIHVPSWRTEIYERAELADRLSFLYAPVQRSAYAINLYRGNRRGAFRAGEIEQLLAVAPLLRQVHGAALRAECGPEQTQEIRAASADSALRRQVPELSPRERAVCARIACGISVDGIAVDLGVAPSTVITLRKRAYAKLAARGLAAGRHHLAELIRRPA